MTRRSRREIERALERMTGGDPDPDPVICLERPDGTLVDADNQPIEPTRDILITVTNRVTSRWRDEFKPWGSADD